MSVSPSEKEDGEIIESEPGQIIIEQRPQRQTSKVFEMKSTNFKTKICEHFKKGSCKNGTKCSFIHPVDVTLPICKFHLGGHCNKLKCEYSHDISSYQCKYYFGSGNCTKANCQFSHDPFKTDQSKNLWIRENYQYLLDIYKTKSHTALGDSFLQYLIVNHPDILSKRPLYGNPNYKQNMIKHNREQQNIHNQDIQQQSSLQSQPQGHQNLSPEPQFSPIDEDSMPSYKSQVTLDEDKFSQPEFEPIESSAREDEEEEDSYNIEKIEEISDEIQQNSSEPQSHKEKMEQKQKEKQNQIIQQQANIIQKDKNAEQILLEADWNQKDFQFDTRPSLISFLLKKTQHI